MCISSLQADNRRYAGTTRISRNNRHAGLIPAFYATEIHAAQPSRFAGGAIAPVPLLDGLPAEWIRSRDAQGHAKTVKGSVVAGFLFHGDFYTREQVARMGMYWVIMKQGRCISCDYVLTGKSFCPRWSVAVATLPRPAPEECG